MTDMNETNGVILKTDRRGRLRYDSGGRLVSTTYSDSTPAVSIAYDDLGRQLTQSNGIAKSTFAYNTGNLQINTETIQYDLDPATPGYEFTRVIDRSLCTKAQTNSAGNYCLS